MKKAELQKFINEFFRMLDDGNKRISEAYKNTSLSSEEKQAVEDEVHSNPFFTDFIEEYSGAQILAKYLLSKCEE